MLVKELRIGNYILGNYMDYGDFEEAEKQEICEVLSLDSVGICEYSIWVEGESATVEQYDSFDPIPLTEEWLLNFGFKPFQKDFSIKGLIIHCRKRGFVVRKSIPIIKHVHQLQNLYFALTGQELTIKK